MELFVFKMGYNFFSGHKIINSIFLTMAYFGIFGRGWSSIKEFLVLFWAQPFKFYHLVGGFILLIYVLFFLLKSA